jgi:hypothetical protein
VQKFIRMTRWDHFLEFLFPARRRVRQAKVRDGIRWLMEHPDEPVNFE